MTIVLTQINLDTYSSRTSNRYILAISFSVPALSATAAAGRSGRSAPLAGEKSAQSCVDTCRVFEQRRS